MSEEQVKQAPAVDPMDQSCDDIDISFPMVPASNYSMRVKSCERVLSKKAKEAGEELDLNNLNSGNLKITWENTTEIQSTKGEQLEPGRIALTQHISLSPTKGSADKKAYTIEDIKRRVTRVVRGTGLKGVSVSDVIRNPSILIDREGVVKVKVKKETAEFPEGNEIGDVIVED